MKYLGTINKQIYAGAYDIDELAKNIAVNVEGNAIQLSLSNVIESTQTVMKMLNLSEVEYISKHSNIKACVYPRGQWSWRKLDSCDDRLKNCYLLSSKFKNSTYIFTVALEEIQPYLYEAELIAVFKL